VDRIEKAMEKVNPTIIKKGLTQNRSKPLDHGEISYTQTQTQELDQEGLIQRRIVAQQKYSPEASVFKMLRTKVLKQLRDNHWNSFAVTAATQGAGKSMISTNLAIAIAMEVNQTVLLVDMDLKYPKVAWYLGIDVKKGLKDYLEAGSDVALSEILINPGIERLVVLPGRGEAVGSSEMISGPKMRDMVKEIRSRYKSRIIIFDMPPILSADDVLASTSYFDAALMVVEEGGNTPDEVKKAVQMLTGVNLLGTVLNKSLNPPEHQTYY